MTFNTTKLDDPVSFPKDDSEWHYFLKDRVDAALCAREYIDSLPETALFYQPADIDGFDLRAQERNKVLQLLGSWLAPESFTNNRNKWINPNHHGAHRYADVVNRCACGLPMLREAFSSDVKQPTHKQEHGDCTKIDRMEARTQLVRNRRDIGKKAYLYGSSLSGWHKRLGYEDRSCFGSRQAVEWGLDVQELGKISRQKKARTCMVLCRTHSARKIAKIYGCSAHTIQRMLRKETQSDPTKLYSIRRANA